MSFTRGMGDGGWAAGCEGAPPPLHVYDTESEAARWYPLPRPALYRGAHPGPQIIHIPVPAPYGDDPLDPSAQTQRRIPTTGMIGRLHAEVRGTVGGEGVRR